MKRICYRSEPYSKTCPKCGNYMSWNPWQGPGTGGWKCSSCGLEIDYKG